MGSVSAKWYDDDHRLMVVNYEGDWTWEQVEAMTVEVQAMMADVSHRVYVLGDMRRSERNMYYTMLRFAKKFHNPPPNMGLNVVVTPEVYVPFVEGVNRLIGGREKKIVYVATIEEAHELLAGDVERHLVGLLQ